MSNLKIVGPALPDMPWEERPVGSKEIMWRYSANPIIGRDALSTSTGASDTPGIGLFRDASLLRHRQSRPGWQGTLPQEMGGEFRSVPIFPSTVAMCIMSASTTASSTAAWPIIRRANCVSAR